jgi:endonuclease/exonuclease/phosphatase family metal-dependent hydrolase
MTLNIWNLSGPWRQRREEIVAWLDLVRPDVVCLQEVVQSPEGKNQARWLADRTGSGYQVAFGPGSSIAGHAFGNAVLSRWPIDATAVSPLPPSAASDDTDRVVLHVRTNGLDVFCTHLAWRLDDGAVRERQVRALTEFVSSAADPDAAVPPILAGDLNAVSEAAEMRYLTGLSAMDGSSVCFINAWDVAGGGGPGNTWDNRNPFAFAEREPSRRIDHVLLAWRPGSGVWVSRAGLACDVSLTGTFASDHFGMVADISGRAPAI